MKNKQKDACYSNYQCAIYVQIITNIVRTAEDKQGNETKYDDI